MMENGDRESGRGLLKAQLPMTVQEKVLPGSHHPPGRQQCLCAGLRDGEDKPVCRVREAVCAGADHPLAASSEGKVSLCH